MKFNSWNIIIKSMCRLMGWHRQERKCYVFRGALHSYDKVYEIFLRQRDFYRILKNRDFLLCSALGLFHEHR